MQSFERTGFWWLPKKDKQKLPGILKFDHQNGPILTLICDDIPVKSYHIKYNQEYPIILGYTSRGPVTLVHNLVTRSVPMGSWVADITLVASIIIEGCHFETIDEITFRSVSVSYTYLVDWAHKPLSDEELADPWKSFVLDPIDVQLDRTSLSFWHSRSGSAQVYRTTVQREVTVSIVPYERFNLEEYYLYFNYHLRNFFTFATGKVNHPVFISAQLSESDLRPVSIYYRVREHFEKSRDVFPHEMLFSLNDVRDELTTCLSNWIDKSEAYSTAHIQYFKTVYQGCLDVETKFLFLAQALDAIGRVESGKKRTDFEERVESICSVIEQDHTDVYWKLLPGREQFVNHVKVTRHGLSHAEQKPNAISSGLEFFAIQSTNDHIGADMLPQTDGIAC